MRTNDPIRLSIANNVTDLVQGDIQEHLPLERIPLRGDVLGLGTTTSLDNGELTFLPAEAGNRTEIYKCHARNGGLHPLRPGDGSGHFPYVCFTSDVSGRGRSIDLATLPSAAGDGLQDWLSLAIAGLDEPAPLYGLRIGCTWSELVVTVASKLCMGQQRRNPIQRDAAESPASIYDALQHYRFAPIPRPGADPMVYLGAHLEWECCGFYDTQPETGRVSVPEPDAHLHLHGATRGRVFGGHLHHQHPESRLARVETLTLYPIHDVETLESELDVEGARYRDGRLGFEVCNRGQLDVDHIGVDVVVDDRYSTRQALRLPWLAAGASQIFDLALPLPPGEHEILVSIDPTGDVIGPRSRRSPKSVRLEVTA